HRCQGLACSRGRAAEAASGESALRASSRRSECSRIRSRARSRRTGRIGRLRHSPRRMQTSEYLRLDDPDAETFEPDIVAFARGDQDDRGNAEILEDLRAEADLAPFAFA